MKKLFEKKNRKYLVGLGFLLILIIPSVVFSQGSTPAWQKDAVDWAQGGNVLEDWFMKEFLGGYKTMVWAEYSTFISTARALGGVFAIIYFATKAYEMMTGDKKVEIMPLLRPFGLCMIIIFWGTFINVISFPTDIVANAASAKYEAQQKRINNLRYQRAELSYAMVNALYKTASETELAAEGAKDLASDSDGWLGSKIKDGLNSVVAPVLELKDRFAIGLQLAITQALELLALWILRVCVYGLFTIQIVYTGILIMLGPFAVAMSILPGWKDSLNTWISRFISVNLYVGIAFIILFVCGILQEFALVSEIAKFKEIVSPNGDVISMSKLLFLKSNGVLSFGVVIVSFFISAITIFSVPSISTWIVSTSGVTSAASSSGRAGSMIARAIKGGL